MQNEQATSTVIVNGEQAKQEMTALEVKAKALKEQLIQANKAGDGKAYDKLSRELKKTQKEMKQLNKESFDVKRVLDNLSGSSMKELEAAQKRLNAQLRSGDVKRNSKEWRENVEAQKRVKNELKAINAEMQVGESRFSKFANGFNKYFSSIAAGFAALAGVTLSLKKYSDNRIDLEDSKANLQALTGLKVEDIAWLTEQAKALSTELNANRIRIRKSSKEIVDAYTLVGSAKPELLENRDALKQVTEQTLILAEASKMDLEGAVKGITMAMNQYSANAREVSRYTNVLAAGSKFGAANVESVTSAILRSGVAAAQANIPIESLVGTIETLAEKGITDEIAGTGLKKFFLTLQTGADDTNPKVVGLEKALENLAKKQLTAAQIKKMFGEEGYNVAAVLISETERVKYFTEAVTGTSVALEQASINSEAMGAKLAQAKNKLNEAGMEFVSTLNPAILSATNLGTKFIKVLVELPRWLKENRVTILALIAVWTAYTISVTAAAAADKLKVFWTGKVITAVKTLTTVVKKNPWAMLLTGGILFLSWLNKYLNKQKEANKEVERFAELTEKAKNLMSDNKSLEERARVMKSLSQNQLKTLRDDLDSQVAMLEQHEAEVLAASQKELDNDKKYQEARKKFSAAKNAYERNQAALEMRWRKQTLLDQLSKEYSANKKSLEGLKKHLNAVKSLIKEEKPEVITPTIVEGPVNNDSAIKKVEQSFKIRRLALMQFLESQLISQQLFEKLSLQEELNFLEDKVKLQKKLGEDSVDTEIEILNLKSKIRETELNQQREHQKEIESMKIKTAFETNEDTVIEYEKYSVALRLKILDEFHKRGLRSEEEYLEELADLLKGNQKEINDHLYAYELKHNEELYEKGLIGRRQYLDNLRQLTSNYYEELYADEIDLMESILEFSNKASEIIQTLIEAETLAVENRYQTQIDAARKAGKDTVELEEQMEQEKKEVKKKYADIDFAITISKIIAETALAIMKAAPNIPLQVLTGAQGLAQLALAAQQRASLKNLWTGGYTEPGGKYEPRGIVHAGEFVASQEAVRNADLRRLFNLVDYAQKTNTVARIDRRLIAQTMSMGGYANGGFTSKPEAATTVSYQNSNQSDIIALLNENKSLLILLYNLLKNGITARTYISGSGGIEEAQELFNKINNNVKRS